MFQRLKWFLALNSFERRLFSRTLFLLPVTELRLRYTSYKQTYEWLELAANRGRNRHIITRKTLDQATHIAKLVMVGVQYSPIKGKCLSRSLVLWHLLICHGIQGNLKIGIKSNKHLTDLTIGNFEAHAWVEYQGEILNDRSDVDERFIVIKSSNQLPANERTHRTE